MMVGAVVAVTLGTAYIAAHDGSPAWQLVRLLIVAGLGAVAILTLRRESAPGRMTVGFVVGALGTAIGVGIALPHLTKSGLTATGLAGLLCLVGGLVLMVGATVEALRHAPGWGKVPVAAAAALGLFVTVWVVGQSVAATNVPPTDLGDRTPADAGLRYEDVELLTSDGVRLSAWYVPSENGAAIVLAHGAGSTRSNVLDHAAVLAGHGYGVVLLDARGHGDSDGRAMDFGWYGDKDVGAAVSFLAERPDVEPDRIGAVGMSMGGEEVIGAAAADGRIRAVVAEGATNRTVADKTWMSDEYGARGWVQQRIDWLTFTLTDLLTSADPPTSLRDAAAAAAPTPVLLIAAGDVPEEEHAGRFIQAGSPESVELWVVDGAGHTAGLETQPGEWEARVVEFLDAALAGDASA